MWFGLGLFPFSPTDLDIFFWPSARIAVHGQPFMVYAANGQSNYPNANGPVSLLPLTAVGIFVNAFGSLDATTPRRAVALAVFSLFVLLMAREAVRTIERVRGRPIPQWPRLVAYATFALATPVWQSVAGYGHIEQPIEIWLMLIAARYVQAERMLPAGVAFALAIFSRSSAVLLSVPLGLAALRQGWLRTVVLFASAAVTGALVLLPFLISDTADVVHSLFTYRSGLVVGAGSVWSLSAGTALEPIVQRWDIIPVLAAVLATNLWLAVRPGGLEGARLFAGMALASASFALLAKTVWPYYFFEAFVFATVWAASIWKPSDGLLRLALPPMALSVFGLVAEIGSDQYIKPDGVKLEGGAMFVMLGLLIVWIAWSASRDHSPAGMPEHVAAVQEAWK
jgi:hypothetical protein